MDRVIKASPSERDWEILESNKETGYSSQTSKLKADDDAHAESYDSRYCGECVSDTDNGVHWSVSLDSWIYPMNPTVGYYPVDLVECGWVKVPSW